MSKSSLSLSLSLSAVWGGRIKEAAVWAGESPRMQTRRRMGSGLPDLEVSISHRDERRRNRVPPKSPLEFTGKGEATTCRKPPSLPSAPPLLFFSLCLVSKCE
jgi:hypothetical protein